MIGSRLKAFRTERDLTQDELGKVLGVGKTTISQYESEARKPDSEMLNRIADYFHTSVDYLLGRTEDPSPTPATDPKTEEAEHRIDEALAEDADPDAAELNAFWQEIRKRPDLFLLFKQVRPMSNDSIRRAIRIIKAIEEEEQDEKNR